ncbi:MAG: YifB family Mg chelatase-like AAA ATPase [Tannerellaceae bacterium]|jgi:magnesium chelatase family protein|nr:YifB family Mg chelatase-like AAA ATPase [Tannerellaceae bacterium]
MLVKSYAAAVQGISATVITIEVSCNKGIQFFLVGLPDVAVRESHERIISALQVSGYKFPRCRIVINMAPADIRKEGSSYDLPLAIGIMAAAEQIDASGLNNFMIMGELSLDGSLLPVKGALPIALKAREAGFKGFILPEQNAREAAVVDGLDVYGMKNIREVLEFIDGKSSKEPARVDIQAVFYTCQESYDFDFSDVRGQENVKRALEVAAAGSHNLLMVGPPGSGKSMLAKRIPSILPPLTLPESLETTKIHSVAGKLEKDVSLMARRPFRSPHHTISDVAMVGGGSFPKPGEISLAHNGVLFLDELPEFNRNVLEVMRQPLEDRTITISRARSSVDYPAGFMLVGSMNPCQCGYYNHPERACICMPGSVQKYMSRVSGPLLDRIDVQVEVTPVSFEKISERAPSEPSAAIRERVIKARLIQEERFKGRPGIYCNAQMTTQMLHTFVEPDKDGLSRLKMAMERLNLSARAYDRILKVSRTIADLAGVEQVDARHIAEAIQYRKLDRENWGM